MALVPAFASPAYYVNKGSSSVGASLVTATPLIASRQLLQAYTWVAASWASAYRCSWLIPLLPCIHKP